MVAAALVALGVLGATACLDAPSDGSVVSLGWQTWRLDGVVVDMPDNGGPGQLRSGDLVTAIAGHRLADGLGGVVPPVPGTSLRYDVARDTLTTLDVPISRVDPYPLLARGWGDVVFVLAFGVLALALYVRRPEEPSTGPLLVAAAGLLGSTLVVVAGLPALALATAGPRLYLFHLNVVGAYSVAWGAVLVFFLTLVPGHPWQRRRRLLPLMYVAPLSVMACWSGVAAMLAPNAVRWLGLVHAGQSVVVALTLLTSVVVVGVAYRANQDAVTRARVRWLAVGGAVATLVSLAGWHLPEILVGRPALPEGALGLAALPFVGGIAVALRRHHLFDIERLVNRSLVYAATVAALAAGYVAVVTLLVSGLRLTDRVGTALAAVCAALALSPLRNGAQVAVNRVMYGDRRDPAAVLARLGTRLQAVMLPADVLPAVVDAVTRSMRLPYAAVEIADGAGGFHLAAQQGHPVGPVHTEPLRHHGSTVGRLLVSGRGRHDPLDPVDLGVIGSLAQQIGAAVQAVRLHEDLLQSRAEVVALREDERRRLRRDLHDGLAPTLAAIGLKANLAVRDVGPGSTAHELLNDISKEVATSLDDVWRLVESLRPPALDELGLTEAVRARALALGPGMSIEVTGPARATPLPAAVETAAYRIAVEAITNAVRHSGGRHCTVLFTASGEGVELMVQDDGHGLDPARATGVGLRSMRERAEEVGGTWSVCCPPAGGSMVRAWLPTIAGGKR